MKNEMEIERRYQHAEEHLWQDMYHFEDNSKPIIAIQGEGGWITDIYGKKYFEGLSGHSCLNLGHGRKDLIQVAQEHMSTLAYMSPQSCHIPSIELASKLSEKLQGSYVTCFSTSGTEANEIAIKIARQYYFQTGKPNKYKIISHYRGYHGGTTTSEGISAIPAYKAKYATSSSGFVHIPTPDRYRNPFGELSNYDLLLTNFIEEVIRHEDPDTIAAVVVEPVLFGGGCIVPSKEYLTRVAELCKCYDLLLIVDEVITGFGRTGEMFGFMHSEGVQPDIITMAKGLTSAYIPLGATAVSREIYSTFKEDGNYLRHFSTMAGLPIGCAIALKHIEILEEEKLVERVAKLGKSILDELKTLLTLDKVGDVRGLGFMFGIEFVEDKEFKQPVSQPFMASIVNALKDKGLLIGQMDNIIRLTPPVTSTEDDLRFVVDTLKSVLNELC